MGYSDTQKGYILLDIHTTTLIVSRAVIFQEDVFPFAQLKHMPTPDDTHNDVCMSAFLVSETLMVTVTLMRMSIMNHLHIVKMLVSSLRYYLLQMQLMMQLQA